MTTPKIKAEIRDNGNPTQLRNEGFVPGVIYSHGEDTKSIIVDKIELQRLFSKHGSSGTIDVELEGKVLPVLIKELQRHVIKDDILHIDLQQLSEDTKVRLRVPISIQGSELLNGTETVLQQQLTEIELQCLPRFIPQGITVDVSNLKLGDNITVRDLDIAKDENYDILSDISEVIVSLTAVMINKEDEEEEQMEEEVEVPIVE